MKRSSSPTIGKLFVNSLIFLLLGFFIFAHPPQQTFAQDKSPLEEERVKSTTEKSTTVKEALGQTSKSASKRQEEFEQAVVKGENSGNPSLEFTSAGIINSFVLDTIVKTTGAKTEEGIALYGSGAVPFIAGLIDNMYDYQPASTQRYIAYLLESAKIVQPAYAQGIGFSSLDPIMSIWTGFRNVAYFMFVLMFLIIGVMIMFRHKISGQTVVTVQQAIPNIVVALIFVTFSYAIGGLLIDAMYLMMYLVMGLFSNSTSVLNSNIFSIGAEFVGSGFNTTHDVIKSILKQVNAGSIIGGLGGITVGFIIAVAMLFGVLKLFIELLKSYVSIILLITFSPIILMTGAMPGQNSFGSWIKNLIGNLVAFPVVLLVLVVSEAINSYGITTGGFAPPFLLGPTVGGGSALAGLVGIGMLLVTPELVKKAKDAMGAKEGVMGELAGDAWGRFKKSSSLVAAPVIGAQTGLAGGALGGAYGGVKGLLQGDDPTHLWERVRTGAKKGALAGAMTPYAVQHGPGFAKGIAQTGKKELEQLAIDELTGDMVEKWGREGGLKGKLARRLLARKAETYRTQKTEDGRSLPPPPQDTTLGEGVADPSSDEPF